MGNTPTLQLEIASGEETASTKRSSGDSSWVSDAAFTGKPSESARKYGSPLKAIRKTCVECMGGNIQFPKDCESACCYLWQFRMGCGPMSAISRGIDVDRKAHPETEKWRDGPRRYPRSPLRAIRAHCLECVENSYEVENCTAVGGLYAECHDTEYCPLWPFRFGVKPETAARRAKLVDQPV